MPKARTAITSVSRTSRLMNDSFTGDPKCFVYPYGPSQVA